MKITNEDIKAVQSRVDVTYEEAERFLIKADGDIERAVAMIKRKRESSFSKFLDEAKRIGAELLTYYFKIDKKDHTYMNIPLILVVLFFVLVDVDTKVWVLVVSIGLILISESQVSIYKEEKDDEDMILKKEPSETESADEINLASTELKEAKQPVEPIVVEAEAVSDTINHPSETSGATQIGEDEDDDYYEITIEK